MPILTHQQATLCVLAAVALIPTSHAFGAGAPVLAGGLRGALPPLRARRAVAPLAGGARMQDTSFFSKFARTIVEKAKADVERTKRLFNGLEGLRSEMSVIDELLSYWQLADADKTLEQLEEALIMRDFGVSTSVKICEGLAEEVKSGKIKQPKDLRNAMKAKIVEILQGGGDPTLLLDDEKPAVLMMVGVNGGGKTTTVGKLSSKFAKEGKSVMLAAGDTFRAAADLQLEEWCQRAGATMAPRSNAKSPAAVMYDAIDASISSGTDVLIADTSGRLHTNANLMAELQKVKGVFDKKMPGKPKEILLVVDSTQGQNVLNQARGFNEAVGITGVVLTKLDGTSKGGVVVSIVDELKVPVKFI
eukprot:CAMPEP_0206274462 /NCGR_PEP_ID=MMETSP0047_2-20121206/35169_1 /ASSEMBLY_ACC=CAM_ASM_000192 /TAXON_ID=195065 /ORGANISM="Chroomonas mesostigmatica_cf, Strain CCMP1168" /LENGTH=360 /DNA_ID=CAMNT_0053703681 /DNA_START=59 /DNA_END=1138 /DNA_ORIENTATION=-